MEEISREPTSVRVTVVQCRNDFLVSHQVPLSAPEYITKEDVKRISLPGCVGTMLNDFGCIHRLA